MQKGDWAVVVALLAVALSVVLSASGQSPQSFIGKIVSEPLTLFTVVLAAASVWQGWLTRRAIRHTRESSERELRAYVSVRTRLPIVRNGNCIVEFVVRNSGKTPAYNLRTRYAVRLDAYPDVESEPVFSPEDDTPVVMTPGGKMPVFVDIPFDGDAHGAVCAEASAVRAAILIEYEDTFGRTWHTFCDSYAVGPDYQQALERNMTLAKYHAS